MQLHHWLECHFSGVLKMNYFDEKGPTTCWYCDGNAWNPCWHVQLFVFSSRVVLSARCNCIFQALLQHNNIQADIRLITGIVALFLSPCGWPSCVFLFCCEAIYICVSYGSAFTSLQCFCDWDFIWNINLKLLQWGVFLCDLHYQLGITRY